MIKLDKSVPIPLYFQLKELVLKQIKDGTYEVGDAIPTEKELSEIYDISRTTVRQAITELVQEGWLYRVKSKGTFVKTPKISQSFIQALGSFNDQIIDLGMTPSTEVLDFEVIEVPEHIAPQLNLKVGEKVIYIHRRRFADNEPIVMVKTYLPYEKCKFVLDRDFVKDSLYPVLSTTKETQICKIRRLIEAVQATKYDIGNLDLTKEKVILQFISVGYNSQEEPIEYSLARYRGDKNRFEIVITAT
ncbi:GntR family transcriptional regulator [Sporosarcina obsidiansis]|uniref:GntR family transcriptional regulator n=1 Tax=Sporosarcina obsidiansis TaxID=2660748 RepID=UPI00129A96F6|nr:GntR family transcriptional regulator [Sporosarcina obsidiansis]